MAIELHGSSPAAASGGFGSPIVTDPFSPPANSLIVVCCAMFVEPTITNSGTARTWTLARAHPDVTGVRIYTAQNPTAQSNITVTVTPGGGEDAGAIKVYVFTGVKGTGAVGATGAGTTATNASNVTGYTSTDSDSFGVAVAVDWNANGTPTSTDNETALIYEPAGVYGMSLLKAATTPTAGTGVTFNLDAAGTAAADWDWVAIELLKSSQSATVDAVTVGIATEVGEPHVAFGQTIEASPTEAAGEVGEPDLRSGQSAKPDPVDAVARVLAPNVVAGSAELVEPAVVEAASDVPTPDVTAEQHRTLTPSPVDASGDVPEPAITATRAWTITPVAVEAQGLVPSPNVTVPVLPGDLITGDWQIEWAGQLYGGHGNVYRVLADSVEGWDNLPGLDGDSALRPSRHGAWPGKYLAQQREVSAIIAIDDPQTFSTSLRALRRATRVQDGDAEQGLVIRTYGEALVANGVVTAREIPTQHYGQGWAQVSIRWTCSDPRRYSLAQYSQVIAAGNSQMISNAGDVATSPKFRILGPVVNPVLVNATLDRILGFDLTVGVGELLEIDTQLGRVRIGSTSHMSTLSAESVPVEDFILGLDENEIAFEVDSGGAAGAECLWSDAYL